LPMEVFVKCVPSAFKHGITEANIRHAILNWRYDDIVEDDPGKHLLIGFDSNANLLEIMYNVIDEQTVRVFHAMKCTNVHLAMLKT
jgi:hypothetical protein